MAIIRYYVDSISRRNIFIILFLLVVGLILVPDFVKMPIGPYAFKQHANGQMLLDMKMNYSPKEAYRLIKAYGQEGRNYYIIFSLVLDIIIPAVSASFVMVSMNFLLRETGIAKLRYKLMLIPLLGWLSDYLENASIIAMISMYPQKLDFVARLANIFTISKGIFCTSGIVIILAMFPYFLVFRRNHR